MFSAFHVVGLTRVNKEMLSQADRDAAVVVSSILAIFGTIGNVLTLVTLLWTAPKKLRHHPTTVYVTSLTISSLLFTSVGLPLSADTFAGCSLCHHEVGCRIFGYLFYANVSSMLNCQAAVAVNRYITICHFKSRISFGCKTNTVLLLLCWLLPLILFAFPLTQVWGDVAFDTGTSSCTIVDGEFQRSQPRSSLYSIGLGIPSIIITFCYVRIYWTMRQTNKRQTNQPKNESRIGRELSSTASDVESQQQQQPSATSRQFSEAVNLSLKVKVDRRQKQETRLTLMLFVIFASFVVCSMPPGIILIIDPSADRFPSWHVPLYTFGWLFGVINPVIYVAINNAYKEAFKCTLHQLYTWFMCQHQPLSFNSETVELRGATKHTHT